MREGPHSAGVRHGRCRASGTIANLAVAAALLAGCGESPQSVLDPHGPDAELVHNITRVLFIGGTVIFLLTMACVGTVVFTRWKLRKVLGSRRSILVMGIVFPALALAALLVWTLDIARALVLPRSAEPMRIEMIGWQFWWEVRYPDLGSGGALVAANEIHIPVGREVELVAISKDVIHSVWIPALRGKIDMIPGRTNRIRFMANRPGVVRGQCAEYCGAQHALMAFYVVAHPPEEFDRWLEQERRPAPAPSTDFLALGQRAFGTAGCGACHAIRGTEWTGGYGPDLTHVGSRLSLAAGALDNHRGTLGGWIAGAQDIKPGNRMPSFNSVLTGEELRAVAAWLESLK